MGEITPYEKKVLKEIEDARALMSQQIVRENHETTEQFEQRKRALTFKQIDSLKHLLLQNVSKNGTNRSFTQYTRELINQYLQNPYSYRDQIREVSRFLWRVSALYKRLIMTYALMPLYNYTLTQKVEFTKKINTNKSMSDYEKTLLRLQPINFYDEFSTAIAIALRDASLVVTTLSSSKVLMGILLVAGTKYFRRDGVGIRRIEMPDILCCHQNVQCVCLHLKVTALI